MEYEELKRLMREQKVEMTAEERMKLNVEGDGDGMGRLYRIAMMKKGVWDGVPIEYARIQTDRPGREAWNHEWKR